jgi:hypothetical protein
LAITGLKEREERSRLLQRVRRNFDYLASERGKKEADYYRE